MRIVKRLLLMLLIAALALPGCPSFAEDVGEAPEITAQCTFQFPSADAKKTVKRLTDDDYLTRWKKQKYGAAWFTAENRETPIAALYFCFDIIPAEWAIQVPAGNDWETVYTGDSRFLHAWVKLEEPAEKIRFLSLEESCKVQVAELRLYGEGSFPSEAQDWQPTVTDADILFLSAHADDELIFFGGGIPTYATERKNRVAVAYLADCGPQRRNELLDGLWSMGVRNYPVIAPFPDKHKKSMSEEYKAMGGTEKVLNWVTALYRQVRPKVVVTHDVKGEYGHYQHRVAAEAALTAYDRAADASFDPDSAAQYGTWQVQKLYHHLGKENRITMNWDEPLASLGGITGLEAAIRAYTYHGSQQGTAMSVTKTGSKYDNRIFGLTRTEVGPDEAGGDFLEHIQAGPAPADEGAGEEEEMEDVVLAGPADGE